MNSVNQNLPNKKTKDRESLRISTLRTQFKKTMNAPHYKSNQ
jgi:hypothetical protein